MMRCKLKHVIFAGVFAFCGTSAWGLQYEVWQGGSLLGTVDGYSGAISSVDNFGLGTDSEANLTYGPTLQAKTSHLFLYEGSDGVNFFVVFDRPDNDNMGSGKATWDMTVSGSTHNPTVKLMDDASEFSEDGSVNDLFHGKWSWDKNHTDGGVLGELAGDWELSIDLISSPSGFSLTVFSGDAAGSHVALDPYKHRVLIRSVSQAVPESVTTWFPFALGCALLFGFHGRIRKADVA